MTTTGKSEKFATQRGAIERYLREEVKNSAYDALVSGSGVLELDEINDDLVDVEKLDRVLSVFGWPQHDVDDSFRETQNMEISEFRQRLSDNTFEGGMLNFRATLAVPPIEEFDLSAPMNTWQGMKPVLHRAYAVMPDLMNGIREALEVFSLSEQRLYLASEEADSTVEAMFVAYKVMTRLVSRADAADHELNSHDVLTR